MRTCPRVHVAGVYSEHNDYRNTRGPLIPWKEKHGENGKRSFLNKIWLTIQPKLGWVLITTLVCLHFLSWSIRTTHQHQLSQEETSQDCWIIDDPRRPIWGIVCSLLHAGALLLEKTRSSATDTKFGVILGWIPAEETISWVWLWLIMTTALCTYPPLVFFHSVTKGACDKGNLSTIPYLVVFFTYSNALYVPLHLSSAVTWFTIHAPSPEALFEEMGWGWSFRRV